MCYLWGTNWVLISQKTPILRSWWCSCLSPLSQARFQEPWKPMIYASLRAVSSRGRNPSVFMAQFLCPSPFQNLLREKESLLTHLIAFVGRSNSHCDALLTQDIVNQPVLSGQCHIWESNPRSSDRAVEGSTSYKRLNLCNYLQM
jgi:hypothetical protein